VFFNCHPLKSLPRSSPLLESVSHAPEDLVATRHPPLPGSVRDTRYNRHLHRRLHLRVIWEVVAVVGGIAVDLRFQGSGIANEGYLCFVVHQGGLHGLSLALGEYFRRCLRPRSWRVP
jgi:hypothetical protein